MELIGGVDGRYFYTYTRVTPSCCDVIIRIHELRTTKSRGYICVDESIYIRSIDACTLRHSRGESLGPWYCEAQVRFY